MIDLTRRHESATNEVLGIPATAGIANREQPFNLDFLFAQRTRKAPSLELLS
jgi:hypothetical protein